MIALAVLCLSAAVIAFQILLVRVFAIEQFHHVAYMAIGVAMLGFGASGTLLALLPPRPGRVERWFPRCAALAALALAATPWLVHLIPLDTTQLLWDARQWPRLGLLYVLLSLPFGLAGAAVLLALAGAVRPGLMYGASFAGSALGAAAALAAAALLPPGRAVIVAPALAALGAVVGGRGAPARVAALAAVALAVALPWRLAVLPYKAMAQVEQYPDARRLFERPSPVGWLVAVQARAFRFAPGLSLGYRGAFPDQHALFVDGELAGARSEWAGDAADLLDWVPAALPYVTGARRRVLVLGNAAGLEVAAALAHGAERVTAVELHPELVRAGQPLGLDAGRVRWVVGDARAHLARTTARHDLIALGPAGGHGAGAGGLHALNEDFLHTVEAYGGFLDRLTHDGVLAITRWLELPPRSAVRVVLMVAEALRRRGVNVSRALVVVRSWNTVTILAKPGGFSEAELAALGAWSDARWFDVDWRPGLRAVPVPRFHMTDDPVLFRAARAASESRAWADEFAAAYLFRVAPATDARPYPHQFVGFDAWRAFARRERGEWLAFAELGYVALVATLAQSAILAALLIVLPVALRARRAPEDGPIAARHRVRLVGYFTAIGLAYLATEIAAIQQLTLLLGHPVHAVTASLAVMLGCSGAGSAWSDRWEQGSPRLVCWVTAALLALLAAGLLPLVHAAQGAPLAARAALAAVALAPAALVMGTPFPLGLRALAARDQDRIAIAWAANGYASAVAAPLAALIAIELGSPVLFAAAGLGYAVAALLSSRLTRGVGLP